VLLDRFLTRQIVIILSESWTSYPARAFCIEKETDTWSTVAGPFSAVVGSNGMAWDAGFTERNHSALTKKEGDRKAPAGVLRLIKAMGYSAAAPAGSAFPYEQIHASSLCIDDPVSEHYNRIFDSPGPLNPIKVDWKSSEIMKRKDDLYKWLIVVDYNKQRPTPGAGSCIFMHVWRSKNRGTAGCTALSEADMTLLLEWLKPELNPVLIQMPVSEYELRAPAWNLPLLDGPVR